MRTHGGVVSGSCDPGDDFVARVVVRCGIGHEDRDGELAAIGKLGQNQVLAYEVNALVQGELGLLHLVQDRERQGQLEDGLHGWMGGRIQIAV